MPLSKAVHQRIPHQTDRTVAVRLEHQQQAAGKRVHGFERGRDLVGVVGEVVDHGDVVGGADDLEPPADAAELAEMRRGLREADAAGLRDAERGERVGDVVQARAPSTPP